MSWSRKITENLQAVARNTNRTHDQWSKSPLRALFREFFRDYINLAFFSRISILMYMSIGFFTGAIFGPLAGFPAIYACFALTFLAVLVWALMRVAKRYERRHYGS
ncbi:hypothetical protein [Rhizobium sp. RM]|uniref:hypothetical protein n=1 Tax=Rhizobium sp. RM TaxID=2748079 RepID=UPI00110EA79B|nr:hypothetical protein [Rhizobium sp. RM]NWJ26056.1 hypothetical protein [Rhizobium sp. RM]TMV20661.1 hypothetical protein BJG94_08120 [Rhizobium sp. Td3]